MKCPDCGDQESKVCLLYTSSPTQVQRLLQQDLHRPVQRHRLPLIQAVSYTHLIPAGIVDPTKVTRSALENAASIGACVLTTESLVVDKPDPAADAAANAAAAAQGGMY